MNEPQCFYNESIAFFLACHRMGHSEQVGDGTWNHHIFIMLANLLVMVTIYVNRRFHFPIYYLMVNLAGADFFFFPWFLGVQGHLRGIGRFLG